MVIKTADHIHIEDYLCDRMENLVYLKTRGETTQDVRRIIGREIRNVWDQIGDLYHREIRGIVVTQIVEHAKP